MSPRKGNGRSISCVSGLGRNTLFYGVKTSGALCLLLSLFFTYISISPCFAKKSGKIVGTGS